MASLVGAQLRVDVARADAGPSAGFLRLNGDGFVVDDQPFVMRGFNYFPRDYGWSAMTDWDWDEVDAELGLAQGLGANTIRTVVDYGFSTGHAGADWASNDIDRLDHPTADYLAAMDRLLSIASRHNLRVVFALFDFMPGWAFVDGAQYRPAATYANDVVAHFATDPRIAAWDILNEGDLVPDKFPTTSQAAVLGFYTAMSASIKNADHQHLVTAGFGKIERAHLSQDFVDFISFHYYDDQARLTQEIDALRGRLHRPMPIVAGEFGAPSDGNRWATISSHTVALGAYLDSTMHARPLAGALIWSLVDPNPPKTTRTRQGQADALHADALDFGVYDGRLQPKPSADVVRRYFGGDCGPGHTIELRFAGNLSVSVPGDARLLAVGVHQLALLGADGTPLSQVKFGTIEANSLEGRGWYANEGWGQWAGELGGTASLCMSVPTAATTVSLTAHSAQPNTELQVWANGSKLGTFTLQPAADDYQVAFSQPPSVALAAGAPAP